MLPQDAPKPFENLSNEAFVDSASSGIMADLYRIAALQYEVSNQEEFNGRIVRYVSATRQFMDQLREQIWNHHTSLPVCIGRTDIDMALEPVVVDAIELSNDPNLERNMRIKEALRSLSRNYGFQADAHTKQSEGQPFNSSQYLLSERDFLCGTIPLLLAKASLYKLQSSRADSLIALQQAEQQCIDAQGLYYLPNILFAKALENGELSASETSKRLSLLYVKEGILLATYLRHPLLTELKTLEEEISIELGLSTSDVLLSLTEKYGREIVRYIQTGKFTNPVIISRVLDSLRKRRRNQRFYRTHKYKGDPELTEYGDL